MAAGEQGSSTCQRPALPKPLPCSGIKARPNPTCLDWVRLLSTPSTHLDRGHSIHPRHLNQGWAAPHPCIRTRVTPTHPLPHYLTHQDRDQAAPPHLPSRLGCALLCGRMGLLCHPTCWLDQAHWPDLTLSILSTREKGLAPLDYTVDLKLYIGS